VNGIGLDSCHVVEFGISSVEPLGSVTRELVGEKEVQLSCSVLIFSLLTTSNILYAKGML
jgi:hypothetical protein